MNEGFFSNTQRGSTSSQSSDRGTTHYGHLCKMVLLLGSLYRGPLYGNELLHMIQEHDTVKITSFYTMLDHLVANQCLYYEVMPTLHASRNRRIYTLTHKGYQQFSTLLHDLLLTDRALNEGNEIALFFLDHLPEAEGLLLLRARRSLLANQRVMTLTKSTSQLIASHLISYRLCLLDAEMAWIDQRVADLQTTLVNA
ncbi:MAG: helix-turn-helix transcriptional regulator [Ktedonobacteraceae bacterium]|nr:helix-turn-helix transcriptional regulator [Ktedonobacteraceae bacterium]